MHICVFWSEMHHSVCLCLMFCIYVFICVSMSEDV